LLTTRDDAIERKGKKVKNKANREMRNPNVVHRNFMEGMGLSSHDCSLCGKIEANRKVRQVFADKK
jgi:hypothetical protein